MRIIPLLISTLITVALIILLSMQWGKVPPIGKFLSPQHGFWQNADPIDKNFDESVKLPDLAGKAEIYFDDRLVPHVFASTDEDAYFAQGYLHAKFRLWQMEFQVYAAAGRLSELIGRKALNYDREKRRLGMVYAAEIAAKEIENDPTSKRECDAYTAGVNAYIANLKESELPVEYKLLNYKPEKWSNLKTALFLKAMCYDLAGSENDFERTNAKTVFGFEDYEKMFPAAQDSVDPIIPKGTVYPPAALSVKQPASADSLYFDIKDSSEIVPQKPKKDNGSNNWVVSGKKTKSGAPILCNDPHLGLNLPSLWYEMQINTPSMNVYGATFPGGPGVIIGFNDSCAFGLTNGGRDVMDYYEIKFRDETMKEYWFNGAWKAADFRYEHILIKGEPEMIDTVAYTVFGPVMFDKKFSGMQRRTNGNYYALRWKGHDPSNEFLFFNKMDHAKNYDDYYAAIHYLHTPGQNCLFACKNGDIAIWTQGEFPAKWKRQGEFIMPGTDSSYMWQGMIPQQENPHLINPERGFLSSANQVPADPSAYPYYLGGDFPPYRGIIINRYLNKWSNLTPKDMFTLQIENYNVFAEMARPVLMKNIDMNSLAEDERSYFDTLANWELHNDPELRAPTLFVVFWDTFNKVVWDDEFSKTKLPLVYPYASTLLEAILKDSAYKFLDNINTPAKETLRDDVTLAFKKAVAICKLADADGRMQWGKYKGTKINHLARLAPFSRTDLNVGGGTNCINATKEDHGPSWRMVVELTPKTDAYGVYPGGQSGNPGSPYYDSFIDTWAAGKYYPLWVMEKDDVKDKKVKYHMSLMGYTTNTRP
ncbi:MAG: penicillin acylase family protein [Bacteroidetes bacterium]|nr:penicillin acylase family protein [Bacteroidota bacterium]